MTASQSPAAFLSYVHSDDDHDRGRITQIRERLEGEIRMHTGSAFKIFQDRNDLEWGQNWEERIEQSLNNVIFLIPIITPSYFNSPACRSELERFLKRELSLGSNQLILPIYYLHCDQIDSLENSDTLGIQLRSRQYSDWRDLRFEDLKSPSVSKQLSILAADIKSRINNLQEIISAGAATSITTEKVSKALKKHERPAAKKMTIKASSYKIYTKEFDEIVRAESFLIGKSEDENHGRLANKCAQLEQKNKRSIKIFESDIKKWKKESSFSAIFLLDNSGSLRGEPIEFLASWIVILSDILERAGISVKVIGFTTRAWKGGQSREKWLKDDKPKSPGRLNDLRYIIYKDFGETVFSASQNFGVMLQEGILKENIDGEALILAKDLLSERVSENKLIAVFSDGAPVDDSTLASNSTGYLHFHLLNTINSIKGSDIKVAAVGINHDVQQYYGENGINSKQEMLGVDFFRIFRRLYGIRQRIKN